MSAVRVGTARAATAEAPSSVANVAVGFDALGFAAAVARDRVRVEIAHEIAGAGRGDVVLDAVDGPERDASIPADAARNTASVAARAMRDALGARDALRVRVTKGIPLASGLGGSAASAVAGAVATAALFGIDPADPRVLAAAAAGEAAASGAPHADNAAASLHGGLVLVLAGDAGPRIVRLRVPGRVVASLVHPHVRLETRAARAALGPTVPLALHARQAARFAAFALACERDDLDGIAATLFDEVVEPQRAGLIPGFAAARRAGLAAGALGLSIAGAGPTLFAWSDGAAAAERVTAALVGAFRAEGIGCDAWTVPPDPRGARLVED